jgi:hypothetical protein
LRHGWTVRGGKNAAGWLVLASIRKKLTAKAPRTPRLGP